MNASSGCARVDQFARADGIKDTAIKPDEQIKRSYAIAGVAEELNGTCPEVGEYRVEHEPGDFGTWGFDFRLE